MTQASTLWNFVLTKRLVFRTADTAGRWSLLGVHAMWEGDGVTVETSAGATSTT